MSDRKSIVEALEEISLTSSHIGAVGLTGVGKTWLLQLLAELAVMTGDWTCIDLDTKGDDIFIDVPAKELQAEILKSSGLKPQRWNALFGTFNYPYGLLNVPLKYQLWSLTPKMIGPGHLELFRGFLSDRDLELFRNAYVSVGGRHATVEDLLSYMLTQKKKPSDFLLSLFASGFISNHSQIEPENLMDEVLRRDFIVIGSNFFDSSLMDFSYVCQAITIAAAVDYLRTASISRKIIWLLREVGQYGYRARKAGPKRALLIMAWITEMLASMCRRTGFSVTRIFWEAQNLLDVSPRILENTKTIFIHPMNLKSKKQLGLLEKYIPVSEEIKRRIAPLKDPGPGRFFMIHIDGSWTYFKYPPPLSYRSFEPADLSYKTLEEEARKYYAQLPVRNLEPLIREALVNLADIKEEVVEKPKLNFFKPTVIPLKEIPQPIATLLLALYYYPEDGTEELSIARRTLSSWSWKYGGIKAQKVLTPVYLNKHIDRFKAFMRALGVSVGYDTRGDLVFRIPDVQTFKSELDPIKDKLAKKCALDLKLLEGGGKS